MQPSELWRRGVVMPLSTGVIERIAAWNVDESVEVDFLPIDDESLFQQLCSIGLFLEINDACSTLIDDYESEWLPPEQFPAAAKVICRLQRQNSNARVGQFLNQLSNMIDRATVRQMPLYFEF
jgi:hypothetical protein